MKFSATARYTLITTAIVTAGVIQIVRGYRLLIVLTGAAAFLFFGCASVYLSGSKERAIRRRQKRDYYAGNS